jgi:hypothetical protein
MAESGRLHGGGLPAPTHIFRWEGTGQDGLKPSYYWSILRYAQAYRTALQLVPIAERIQRRIKSAADWSPASGVPDESNPGAMNWVLTRGPRAIERDDRREASFIASETLHYLRSSLEYLVYNVCWFRKLLKNAGRNEKCEPPKGTQFPICEDRDEWDRRSRTQLVGMSDYQRDWIEKVQPYNDVKWTKTLRDLSNADKHRVGVQLSPVCQITVNVAAAVDDPKNKGCKLAPVEDVSLTFQLPALSPPGEFMPGEFMEEFNSMFIGVGELINLFGTDYEYYLYQFYLNEEIEIPRIKLPC